MTDRRLLGLIPARGGSKGIPQKNIRDLAGVPLVAHSIQAAREAPVVDDIVVSTDDSEIASVAEEYGASVPFLRPPELATDEAPTEPVIAHALDELRDRGEEFDVLVLLQPTSPLRTSDHISEAYTVYERSKADSLISAYPTMETRWRDSADGAEKLNYRGSSNRRQDRTPEYVVNGAIYMVDVHGFTQKGELTFGKTAIYEMSEIDSVDIDEPFDLWLTEQILEDWK